MRFLCFPAKWRFKGTSNSITDRNIIVRLQCMKNLNHPEGAGLIYNPSLKTTIARHRGHKEVMGAHVTCKIWKKNLLTLQGVETLLKSVGAVMQLYCARDYAPLCLTMGWGHFHGIYRQVIRHWLNTLTFPFQSWFWEGLVQVSYDIY